MREPILRTRISSSVIATAAVLLLAGCDAGLGKSVIVINQTNEPLTIRGSELRPNGGDWNHGFQGCSQAPLDVLDGDGEKYVQIDAGWCDGETWTITGPGEVYVDQTKN